MKFKDFTISAVLILALSQTNCSAVSKALSALTSTDCDNWILDEISQDLSEECRNLADYISQDSSSLAGSLGTGLSQALPISNLSTTGLSFIQLTDSAGLPLSNISSDNIGLAVSTDGGSTFTNLDAPDSITTLSEADTLQTSILMLLDYSGSILDSDLNDINSGLNVFYDNIISDATSSVYQSGIIKFSSDVTLVQDFTQTKADLITAVDDTNYTRASTSLYDSIYEGVDQIKDESTALKLLVLFTDGVDNSSSHTKNEAISHAQENKVPVCVVGVGFANVSLLEEIASDTGCFYIYKAFFTSLDDAFENLAEQFNNLKVIDLPDSFSDSTGILKISVDAGEDTAREILQSF